jgi:hypothetical protein
MAFLCTAMAKSTWSQIEKPDGIHQFCRDIMPIDHRHRGNYRTELEEMFDSSIATEQSLHLPDTNSSLNNLNNKTIGRWTSLAMSTKGRVPSTRTTGPGQYSSKGTLAHRSSQLRTGAVSTGSVCFARVSNRAACHSNNV